ncbi:MAG: hypothetical protein F4X74_01365 [Acidimicrobiia bacterium]|nr:hypothetical protein [Acidimicrobiia bacterium]
MRQYFVGKPLFCSETLSGRFAKIERAAVAAVQKLPCDDILANTPEATLESARRKYGRDRTRLNRDTTRSRQTEVRIDVQHDFGRGGPYGRPVYVPGVKIELVTTFRGPDVFALRPSTYSLNPPRGYVQNGTVVVGCSIPLDVLESERTDALRELKLTIDRIEVVLQRIEADTDDWESQMHDLLRQQVEIRRRDCLAMRETSLLLGFPTEDDSTEMTTYTVPIPRRRGKNSIYPPTTGDPSRLEPRISDGDFASIVLDIRRTLGSFERLPKCRVDASEESLRNEIIAGLQHQGPATGESYSKRGKSDIYLPHADHAVFLAECKWWHGKKVFADEALPQLLDRYVIWRDTHAAMILFIRNKNATSAINQAVDAIRSHPRFVSELERIGDTRTFRLHHDGDEARFLRLALLTAVIVP